jgi:DNA-dependent RNA polymerase auxiliary subunit epsilon
VKALFLSILLLPILASAQNIVADNYYFILEGDTIEGFYLDFEIENGKFELQEVAAFKSGLFQFDL